MAKLGRIERVVQKLGSVICLKPKFFIISAQQAGLILLFFKFHPTISLDPSHNMNRITSRSLIGRVESMCAGGCVLDSCHGLGVQVCSWRVGVVFPVVIVAAPKNEGLARCQTRPAQAVLLHNIVICVYQLL